ncbi:MAG: DUF1328 domain-containing protein [Nitrospirales bacterium]|nr:DUF1328 domain-containing protein [Nitrospirales bacterium]
MIFLKWSAIFLVIALIAAVFGFTGVAEGAAEIAKILFYLFLGLCGLLLFIGIVVYKKIT